MMSQAELVMRRRNVRACIKADAVDITIIRRDPSTPTPAGGLIAGDEKSLSPQEARIVLNKRRYNNGLINSEAGEIPHTDYLLIAEWKRDIQVNDEFFCRGDYYKVTGIYGNRIESYLCSIDLLGPENRNV